MTMELTVVWLMKSTRRGNHLVDPAIQAVEYIPITAFGRDQDSCSVSSGIGRGLMTKSLMGVGAAVVVKAQPARLDRNTKTSKENPRLVKRSPPVP